MNADALKLDQRHESEKRGRRSKMTGAILMNALHESEKANESGEVI